MRGVNLLDLSLSRFCNAILAWALGRVENPDKFRADLFAEDGVVSPTEVPEEVVRDEMAAFGAFMTATKT